MRFYIPPKLVENYDKFLQTSVCKDIRWCRFFIPDDDRNEWVEERAEITRLNYKSKQYGADGSLPIRLSKNSKIKKGDVVEWAGKYYLVSWYVHDAIPDSQATMLDYCNVRGCFFRENESGDHVDHLTGEILEEAPKYLKVTNDVYGFYILNGNYEKRLKNSQAGLFNDNRTSLMVQSNPDTLKVKRGDLFVWLDEVHQVDDISLVEVDENGEGILTIHMGLTLNDDALDYIHEGDYDEGSLPYCRE